MEGKTTIVAWGSTGSGKSSFLNVVGGSYFKLKEGNIMNSIDLFEPQPNPVELFKASAGVDSCTYETNIKEGNWFGNEVLPGLVMIDTPGLGDSRGVLQDSQNIAGMVKHLKDISFGVNLFLLVINATNPRFDENLTELIKIFQQIFEPKVWENVSLLFTHWSGSEEEIEDRESATPQGISPEKLKEQQFIAKISEITGGCAPKGAFFMDCNPRIRQKNADGTIKNLKNLFVVAKSSVPFSCANAKETQREKQRLAEEKAAETKRAEEAKREADRARAAAEQAQQQAEINRQNAERARIAQEQAQKQAQIDRQNAEAAQRRQQEAERALQKEKEKSAYNLLREQTKRPTESYHPEGWCPARRFGRGGHYTCCKSSSGTGCQVRGGEYTMPPWSG